MLKKQKEKFKPVLSVLPDAPGVYQFFNAAGEIIYIGKAKNIQKRVSSYFSKERFENNKIRVLVTKIDKIEYIVVETESDALLLENNLIKKYRPRYNAMLKDDKTFHGYVIKKNIFHGSFIPEMLFTTGQFILDPILQPIWLKFCLT